jgi:hypothetical protein
MSRFLIAISGALLALKMVETGTLPLPLAALLMIGVVFLAANGSKAVGIVLAAAGVLWFVVQASGGNIGGSLGLLGLMLQLMVILLGFYVMFGGLSRSRVRTRR